MVDKQVRELLWKAEQEIAPLAEQVSTYIFMHPEKGDEEHLSSKYLTDEIAKLGFKVTYPYMGMDTAFRCELGEDDGPAVGFLAEYDALPGYGENHDQMAHACGHNWIAASTFAACAALAKIKDQFHGKIVYIGTPAEETMGRKVDMAKNGAFDDLKAVFQMHLNHDTMVDTVTLAMVDFLFEFKGVAAHAASNAQNGVNALEACNLTMAGVNALRQHLEADVRVHYIIKNGGGAPNVVPDYASMEIYVRAGQKDYLETVIGKVLNCAKGAELMTGAQFSYTRAQNTYYDMKKNVKLNEMMKEKLTALGISDFEAGNLYHTGSSDVGNVSYVCPTCFCEIGTGAYSEATVHEEAYLKVVDSKEAHRLLHIAAKAMAEGALEVYKGMDF